MRHLLYMYRRMASLSVRSQLRYRSSLALSLLSQFLIIGVEFLALALLFQRFRGFQGWSLPEMAFLYGLVNMAFAIADALAFGFDQMAPLLKSGNFDRLLVRPLPVVAQLMGMEITLRRGGRLVLGLSTFGWGLWQLAPKLDLVRLAVLLPPTLVAGILVFLSLFLIQAAFTFVTIEGLEFMNAFTYGGQQTASYPLTAYRKFIQAVFLAILPVGSCLYLPACLMLGRSGFPGWPAWLHALAPLACLPFAGAALLVWRQGTRWYSSAGG